MTSVFTATWPILAGVGAMVAIFAWWIARLTKRIESLRNLSHAQRAVGCDFSTALRLLAAVDQIEWHGQTDDPRLILVAVLCQFPDVWEELKEPLAEAQARQLIAARRFFD